MGLCQEKVSAVALNLLWFVELQGITHSEGAGAWGAVKEGPEPHKQRDSEQAVTPGSWQECSWEEE